MRKPIIDVCALTLIAVVGGVNAAPQPSAAQTTTLTHSRAKQSSEITSHAEQWKLTGQEWTRYQRLIQGPRGWWSPKLDPLVVLGIHAENDQERMRYAELQAQVEHQRITQELAFQKAFRSAFARLYPDLLPIMPQRLSRSDLLDFDQESKNMRILYFPKLDCSICKLTVTQLLALIKNNRVQGVDIYLVDATTEADVRKWAKQQEIPLLWVQSGRISLNLDQGVLQRLTQAGKHSELFVRSGEDIRVLDRQQYGL